MSKFALSLEPVSYQISFRIAQLNQFYGASQVHYTLNGIVKDMENQNIYQQSFDDSRVKLNNTIMGQDHKTALTVHVTQMIRYYGVDAVRGHWNMVYTQKVA
jgi:hypothetical protein